MGELSCNWMGTNGVKLKIENEWFPIAVSLRYRQNLKFGDFTSLLTENRKNMSYNHEHEPHDYFSSFNQ